MSITGDASIWDLKLKIQEAMAARNSDEEVLEQANQRIVFRGRLLNNEMKINEVPHLEQEGAVLHVVRIGAAQTAGPGNQNDQQRENLEQRSREELVNAKIRSLRTLLRLEIAF